MRIEYDAAKRAWTLRERGLDFKAAPAIFENLHLTTEDTRRVYGERRFVTIGLLAEYVVVLVWTPRGTEDDQAIRIISLRRANEREIKVFQNQFPESGGDTGRPG